MAYLNSLPDPPPIQSNRNVPSVGNLWPNFEVQTPQYPIPSVYNLILRGYKRDELVFACINYRADSVAEPPLRVYERSNGEDKEIEDHPLTEFIDNPNDEMGQLEFWQASEIYTNIAGFVCWEIEQTRMGEPLRLWPLNPLYCSFMRGRNKAIRAVRYFPPGMEPYDIPREKLIIFQEFDPQWPFIRSYSRIAAAFRSIDVHAGVTDFLKLFFERGAVTQGILTTTQSLMPLEGQRLKEEWRESHGGVSNWSDITVLGSGTTYQPLTMSFKEMAFAEVDGRTESLICMTFRMSPLLIAAKVGLAASTFSNYDQAKESFITDTMGPRWRWYASEMKSQLLPLFDTRPGLKCKFDLTQLTYSKNKQAAQQAMLPPQGATDEKQLPGAPNPQDEVDTTEDNSEEDMKSWRTKALSNVGKEIGCPFDVELIVCRNKDQVRRVFEKHWPKRDELKRANDLLERALALHDA